MPRGAGASRKTPEGSCVTIPTLREVAAICPRPRATRPRTRPGTAPVTRCGARRSGKRRPSTSGGRAGNAPSTIAGCRSALRCPDRSHLSPKRVKPHPVYPASTSVLACLQAENSESKISTSTRDQVTLGRVRQVNCILWALSLHEQTSGCQTITVSVLIS